jgi:transcriptional regulator with XRE-family HTH domain
MLDYKEIGKRIKKARCLKGMTQFELAESTGLCDTYISRIERGIRNASLESLAKISRILDVSLDDLVFGSENAVQLK